MLAHRAAVERMEEKIPAQVFKTGSKRQIILQCWKCSFEPSSGLPSWALDGLLCLPS